MSTRLVHMSVIVHLTGPLVRSPTDHKSIVVHSPVFMSTGLVHLSILVHMVRPVVCYWTGHIKKYFFYVIFFFVKGDFSEKQGKKRRKLKDGKEGTEIRFFIKYNFFSSLWLYLKGRKIRKGRKWFPPFPKMVHFCPLNWSVCPF